jgi:hypothetical protein
MRGVGVAPPYSFDQRHVHAAEKTVNVPNGVRCVGAFVGIRKGSILLGSEIVQADRAQRSVIHLERLTTPAPRDRLRIVPVKAGRKLVSPS